MDGRRFSFYGLLETQEEAQRVRARPEGSFTNTLQSIPIPLKLHHSRYQSGSLDRKRNYKNHIKSNMKLFNIGIKRINVGRILFQNSAVFHTDIHRKACPHFCLVAYSSCNGVGMMIMQVRH